MYYLLRPAEDISREITANPELSALLEPLRKSAIRARDSFSDDAAMVSGWGHDFVCPKCAGPLKFDESIPDNIPCMVCEGVGTGQEVHEAWVYNRRSSISVGICNIGLMVYLGEEGFCAEDVLRPIRWYADHYHEFPEHGRFSWRGRIMVQALDESVWAIRMMHALRLIGFNGLSELGRELHHKLFLPISRLCMAQAGKIHNIPLWLMSGAVATAVTFGDERLLEQALGRSQTGWITGDLGGYNQVTKGFTADGLWHENSTGYHYYATEAANNMMVFLTLVGKGIPELYERLCKAYTAPISMAFANGDIPSVNDGWRGYNAFSRDSELRAAYRMLSNVADTTAIAQAVWKNPEAAIAPSLGSLLYGTPARPADATAPTSANLTHNYMAMMRGPFEVFLKYGNITDSHAHPDALHIDIFPWARDTGTPGYGSQLHREFFVHTICHNAFVIDGKNMSRTPHGECMLGKNGLELHSSVKDAYPCVDAKRSLVWHGNVLHDDMTVSCDAERTIDWVFHAKGDFAFEGVAEAAEPLGDDNGYQHLRDVRQWTGEKAAFSWTFEGQTLFVQLEVPQGAEIYFTTSPDNPGHLTRNGVIVRVKGYTSQIHALWSAK